ncbi:MAG: sodium:proton antiporter [Oenococcus sp.]|uniref:cation:proton antiporter n=1 Tax=Oenococcus sp. TaxID=1979414 RepID=UPI0039EAB854
MDLLLLFPIVISLIVASSLLAHFFPLLPVSLLQIVCGVGLSFFIEETIGLDTEWFLLIFIAPLLFNDAWRFPKRELWQLRAPIIANAFVLVFVTALGGGWLIHILIPVLPLSVSIALAAALSPTDPVSVGTILSRIKIPDNLLHVLMGESLLNDASGLVAFKYAVSATVLGSFVMHDAFFNFIYITIVGALTGFLLISMIDWAREIIRQHGANDEIMQVIISILAPFLIFYIAEDLEQSSGVVAVVVAGILTKLRNNADYNASFEFNVLSETIWRALAFVLNGTIFIILGLELPHAYEDAIINDQLNLVTGILYGILVWCIIFVIRAVWTYINEYISYKRNIKTNPKPAVVQTMIMAFSGVRGAIALAAVLSIQMVSGRVFPHYYLMVFIAAVVVIFSLIVASIMLPILTKLSGPVSTLPSDIQLMNQEADFNLNEIGQKERQYKYISETEARIFQLQSGIQALKFQLHDSEFGGEVVDPKQAAIYDLVFERQQKINDLQLKSRLPGAKKLAIREQDFRVIALQAEVEAIEKIYSQKKISAAVYHANMRGVRWSLRDIGHRRSFSFQWFLRVIRRMMQMTELQVSRINAAQAKKENAAVHRARAKAGIKALAGHLEQQTLDKLDRQAAFNTIINYRSWLSRIKASKRFNRNYDALILAFSLTSIDAERDAVKRLFETHRIPRQLGMTLLQEINFAETSALSANGS